MSAIPDITIEQFILEKPTALFIADLHLDKNTQLLNKAFLSFLECINIPDLNSLYILGDWFNAWLGDDCIKDAEFVWIQDVAKKLTELSTNGTTTYFCSGNRDFTLGKDFMDKFGGVLLSDVSYLTVNNKKIRLEHGDLLCSDDISYQRFRKIIRNPVTLKLLNSLSLKNRKFIAHKLRRQSKEQTQQKQAYIMDVNEDAVKSASLTCNYLVHGHTHRPNIHYNESSNKVRFVLGDWRTHKSSVHAVIGLLDREKNFKLVNLIMN